MIFGIATRVAGDDDVVAWFERVAGHALLVELQSRAPLDGVADGVPLRVLALDVHERMRVAEEELHQLAFDALRLFLEVRRRKRVMRERGRRGCDETRERSNGQREQRRALHRILHGATFGAPAIETTADFFARIR